jgi:hypothetical protein
MNATAWKHESLCTIAIDDGQFEVAVERRGTARWILGFHSL